MESPAVCTCLLRLTRSPRSPCEIDVTSEPSSHGSRQGTARPLYPRPGTRTGKNGRCRIAGFVGLFALLGRVGSRDAQRFGTGSRRRGSALAKLSDTVNPLS